MDADRFDALSRRLGRVERRGLLRLLAALPLAAVLSAVVGSEDAEAERPLDRVRQRAQRRQQRRHRHRKNAREGQSDHGDKNDAPRGGACIKVDQLCSYFDGPPCCSPTVCNPTLAPLVTTCQLACSTDEECHTKLGTSDVSCVADAGACPFHTKCCRPKTCTGNGDCPTKGLCCRDQNSFTGLCCLDGQKCTPGIGCQPA